MADSSSSTGYNNGGSSCWYESIPRPFFTTLLYNTFVPPYICTETAAVVRVFLGQARAAAFGAYRHVFGFPNARKEDVGTEGFSKQRTCVACG